MNLLTCSILQNNGFKTQIYMYLRMYMIYWYYHKKKRNGKLCAGLLAKRLSVVVAAICSK